MLGPRHDFCILSMCLSPHPSLPWFCRLLRQCHTHPKPEPAPSFPTTPLRHLRRNWTQEVLNSLWEPISSYIQTYFQNIFLTTPPSNLLGSPRSWPSLEKRKKFPDLEPNIPHWPCGRLSAALLETSGPTSLSLFLCALFLLLNATLLPCLWWSMASFLNNAELAWEAGIPGLLDVGLDVECHFSYLRRQRTYLLHFEGWNGSWSSEV